MPLDREFSSEYLGQFKSELKKHIEESWSSLSNHLDFNSSSLSATTPKATAPPKEKSNGAPPLNQWLDEFISYKESENITPLSIHQLKQRIHHFITFYLELKSQSLNTALFMSYIERLNLEGRSTKTNKGFLASVKQFFKWLTAMEKIPSNPTQNLLYTFKSNQHASDQRSRWSESELHTLIHHPAFNNASKSLFWITLLQLYMGLRPSEACQLRTIDVRHNEPIPCISITDAGEHQHVKNKHAIRKVPVHPDLIEMGFIAYVKDCKTVQLFECRAKGKNQDWSKQYRTQFGRIQCTMGMLPGSRPTAYGLRHTFIDTLKQQSIEEVQVAELVGHTNHNMTYGRYGKRLNLNERL
ncbi:hypothetical protein A9264_14810, partial [Vibrio sp. UCD-FRSSP16_10]